MFFYGYHYYIKKHDIIDDIPNIFFDDDKDEVILGDDSATREGFVVGDDFITTGHKIQDILE